MSRGNKIIDLGRVLRFSKKYIADVLSGRKNYTIRWGIVRPKYRIVNIVVDNKVVGKAEILEVRYVRVRELNDYHAMLDGFRSRYELLRDLRKIYPGIRSDDWVTIIKFRVLK